MTDGMVDDGMVKMTGRLLTGTAAALALTLCLGACAGTASGSSGAGSEGAGLVEGREDGEVATAGQEVDPNSEVSPDDWDDGDWRIFSRTTSTISSSQRESWDEATKEGESAACDPVLVVATQVDEQTAYAFLARGVDEPTWQVVVVTVDGDDQAAISSMMELDLSQPRFAPEDEEGELPDGWKLTDSDVDNLVLEPSGAQSAFSAAYAGYEKTRLNPVATLGYRFVKGTDYQLLCVGKPNTGDGAERLYLVSIHAEPGGEAHFVRVAPLDLPAYVRGW